MGYRNVLRPWESLAEGAVHGQRRVRPRQLGVGGVHSVRDDILYLVNEETEVKKRTVEGLSSRRQSRDQVKKKASCNVSWRCSISSGISSSSTVGVPSSPIVNPGSGIVSGTASVTDAVVRRVLPEGITTDIGVAVSDGAFPSARNIASASAAAAAIASALSCLNCFRSIRRRSLISSAVGSFSFMWESAV
jgi:hypothetical protein